MQKITINNLPTFDSALDFPYQKTLVLENYTIEFQSKIHMINLTKLNDEINTKLGKDYALRNYMRSSTFNIFRNELEKRHAHTGQLITAMDEHGQVWAYKTVAVDFIVMRDKSAKAEIYERIFSEAMIDIPYESTREYTKLGKIIAGMPVESSFLDVPEEAKQLGYRADDMLKDALGIERFRADDLGKKFYTARIEVMRMLQNMVASGIDNDDMLNTMIGVVIRKNI